MTLGHKENLFTRQVTNKKGDTDAGSLYMVRVVFVCCFASMK